MQRSELPAGPLVLTIDVGTSSVRAMLFDAAGNEVDGMEVQQTHQMRSTADGGVETDADTLVDRVVACVDQLLERAGKLCASIGAVAPTTFWHNVLGVSDHGAPVTPIFTWADTRATAAAEALKGELDAAAVHARTGCELHPSYLPAKIRWLSTDRVWKSRIHRRVRRWMSFAEYMLLRFFGRATCSISMASGTGLLNQHTCRWDSEVLRVIPLDETLLSDLGDAPFRGLTKQFAARWPALAHVPWYPGWGDGATSNVGSGCVTKARIAMMIGTSGAMRAVFQPRRLRIPAELWCYRVDNRRVVMGGALSNGGNLIDWLRATMRLPDDQTQLEQIIAGMGPDEAGLTILPFLAGERSTGWHSDARATFSGMTLHTRPEDIYRAGHEAVAYRFDLIYRPLKANLKTAHQVIASGGALLHSPAWMQLIADVLGTTITASAAREASSRGAALLALEALGNVRSIAEIEAPTGKQYHTNRRRARIFRSAADRQRALYDVLILGEPLPAIHRLLATKPARPLAPAPSTPDPR